jgi:gliding motility-associated-like protein
LVAEFPPSTLNITDAPLNAILFNQTGNYSISVVETNFGCVGPGSDIYEIQVLGPPDVNILGDAIVCKGDTADYRVTLNEDSYYRWSSTNSLVIDSLNNESVVYFPQEGTATLTINALNQCGERTLEKTISVRPLPIANAGADTTLCEEGEVNLETPAGQGYNFAWTFNEEEVSNQRLFSSSVAEETMIVITVTGPAPAQCKASDTAFVFIETPPFGQLDTVELCKESEVFLLADTTAIAYLWSTGETGPVISVSDSGYFQVILFFDDQLCYRVDTFFVMPIPCFEPFDLPNAFSPNGDAFNETFKAGTTFFYNSFSIVIYNRWGQLVFESANPFFEWNGSDTNGNTLPEGTYFYVAKVSHTNNYELEKKGTVTLLR